MDVLTDMKTALPDSVRHGKTLTQFQEVLPLLQRKGWLGKGLKASADGELEGKSCCLTDWRLFFAPIPNLPIWPGAISGCARTSTSAPTGSMWR
ncbi:MAG: hypothetical protein ACR5LG_10440 [Sodalis sp. (in: enterobacteria)]